VVRVTRLPLFKISDPLQSLELMKLDTSNLVQIRRHIAASTSERQMNFVVFRAAVHSVRLELLRLFAVYNSGKQ